MNEVQADGGQKPDCFAIRTYVNPYKGYTGGSTDHPNTYYWTFDSNFVTWGTDTAGLWNHSAIEWQMENKDKNQVSMVPAGDGAVAVSLVMQSTEVTWPGSAPFTARTSGTRLSRWGRTSGWGNSFGSSNPLNLWIKIGGKRYVIPDLWAQGLGNDFAISSNWMDYKAFHPLVAGSFMECYGYEDGDLKKPCVLMFTTANGTTKDTVSKVLTKVVKVRNIDLDAETVTAWQDEFNFRLAIVRFNFACDSAYDYQFDPDGYLGWLGRTDHLVQSFLKTDVPLGNYGDPLVVLGQQDVTMIGKDLYVVDVQTSSQEVEYVQTFTVQNVTDKAQTVRTSDYAWQHTDTNTFTWGMSESVSVKLTWKWEAEFEASMFLATAKTKVSFQFEAGYTHTFSQSWTETHTDTRTYTMAGQAVALDPHTAAHVDAVLMKVTASGKLGQAVLISGNPGVKVAALSGHQLSVNFWDAAIDLCAAAKALQMSSVHTSWTPQNGPEKGKTIEGALCTPTLAFITKVGAAGTAQIVTAQVVPPSAQPEAIQLMKSPSVGGSYGEGA